MVEFLKWTAWTMEKPPAYGVFHLSFFFAGLALSLLAAYLLRRTNEKQNRIVLLTCGIFLVLSELYKQLFYTYVIGGGAYQWWIFPFQLCSVPMYLCLLAPFCRGKVQQYMYSFLLCFNLMGGFIAFLEPSGLTHEYWTLTLHAFIWHMTLVFVGLYLGLSRRAGRTLGEYKGAVIMYVSFSAIAFGINLATRKVSNGDVNMFFVGPSNSSLIVFKDICERFGWYVNLPIYIFAICAAAFIFILPFYFWNRSLERKANAGAAGLDRAA